MRIGIVGSEAAKFTPETELRARHFIRGLLHPGDVVISGGCHLGGIDIWAVEEAENLGLEIIEHKPAKLQWEGGYKQRNLKIARDSDLVVCITTTFWLPWYDVPARLLSLRYPTLAPREERWVLDYETGSKDGEEYKTMDRLEYKDIEPVPECECDWNDTGCPVYGWVDRERKWLLEQTRTDQNQDRES